MTGALRFDRGALFVVRLPERFWRCREDRDSAGLRFVIENKRAKDEAFPERTRALKNTEKFRVETGRFELSGQIALQTWGKQL